MSPFSFTPSNNGPPFFPFSKKVKALTFPVYYLLRQPCDPPPSCAFRRFFFCNEAFFSAATVRDSPPFHDGFPREAVSFHLSVRVLPSFFPPPPPFSKHRRPDPLLFHQLLFLLRPGALARVSSGIRLFLFFLSPVVLPFPFFFVGRAMAPFFFLKIFLSRSLPSPTGPSAFTPWDSYGFYFPLAVFPSPAMPLLTSLFSPLLRPSASPWAPARTSFTPCRALLPSQPDLLFQETLALAFF